MSDSIDAIASHNAELFRDGQHGRVDGSTTVHSVRIRAWYNTHRAYPSCRTPISDWLTPTRDPVTCERCGPDTTLTTGIGNQPSLFETHHETATVPTTDGDLFSSRGGSTPLTYLPVPPQQWHVAGAMRGADIAPTPSAQPPASSHS